MDQTTLSTIPRLISQVLSIYDVDSQALFDQAGINISDLSQHNSRVPMDKMTTLWELAVKSTNNQEIGLVAASLFQPTYLKGIGLAWMASSNLEEGLRRFVKNSQLINTAMQIKLIENDDNILIQYQANDLENNVIKSHHCAIQLGVGFFLKMFRLAASKPIPTNGVYFKFPIAKNISIYEEYFQCTVYDNSEFNGISFDKSLLQELLPSHDPELVELNEKAVQNHLFSINDKENTKLVIKAINELLPIGCPTEEAVAYKLHMSKRTLQRKLSNEENTYSSLLSSVRLNLAKQYLSQSKISISEITYQLGYASPSAFARAFKKLTNNSPVEYRKSNLQKHL